MHKLNAILILPLCLSFAAVLTGQAQHVFSLDSSAPFEGNWHSGPSDRPEEYSPGNNAATAFYNARSCIGCYKIYKEKLLQEEQFRLDQAAGVEQKEPWEYSSKEGRLKLISDAADDINNALLILAKHIREKSEEQFLEVASADTSVNKENAKKVLAQGIAILRENGRDVSDLEKAPGSP